VYITLRSHCSLSIRSTRPSTKLNIASSTDQHSHPAELLAKYATHTTTATFDMPYMYGSWYHWNTHGHALQLRIDTHADALNANCTPNAGLQVRKTAFLPQVKQSYTGFRVRISARNKVGVKEK